MIRSAAKLVWHIDFEISFNLNNHQKLFRVIKTSVISFNFLEEFLNGYDLHFFKFDKSTSSTCRIWSHSISFPRTRTFDSFSQKLQKWRKNSILETSREGIMFLKCPKPVFQFFWIQIHSEQGRSQRRGAWVPQDRSPAPPPLSPNEMTLCTGVYRKPPFWVPSGQPPPRALLSPPHFKNSGYAPDSSTRNYLQL